jgi:type I restriction enzyme S subunit
VKAKPSPTNYPSDWKFSTLNSLNTKRSTTINPKRFPDEQFEYYSIPAYQDDEIPFLTHGNEIESSKLLLEEGTVLFGKLNPRVEKVWRVGNYFDCRKIGSTEWIPILPTGEIEGDFLYYLFWSAHVMPRAKSLVSGSTPSRQRVDPRAFYQIQVPVPSLPEQHRIVQVVATLQTAIKQVDRSIALTRELKTALIHKLFTEGLHGEKQKETEIGLMPESWEIVELASLLEETEQVNLRTEGKRQIKYIDVSSISRAYLRVETTTEYLLKDAPGRARKKLKTGDVIFVTVRPTLLRVAYIGEELNDQVCSTAFCILRAKKNISDKYIYYVVQREQFIKHIAAIESGASYPAVTDRQVKNQKVPKPKFDEQSQIAEMLDACDKKAFQNAVKKEKLEELFRTLLHQLMTGQIRVNEADVTGL